MKRFTRIASIMMLVLTGFLCLHGCARRPGHEIPTHEDIKHALQHVSPAICVETKTERMWQVDRSKITYSPEDAKKYAAELRLGGYTDWRLPTRQELFSLYYINLWKKNGECSIKGTGEYWINREGSEAYPGHWETEFLCSPVHKFVKSVKLKGYVRAVRP